MGKQEGRYVNSYKIRWFETCVALELFHAFIYACQKSDVNEVEDEGVIALPGQSS